MGRKERKMIYDIAYPQRGLKLKDLPNCEAIIIRLGIKDHIDSECMDFYNQAIDNNIRFGLYWFTYAYTLQQAQEEVAVILKLLKNLQKGYSKDLFKLPLFIDYELDGVNSNQVIKPLELTETYNVFVDELYRKGIIVGSYLNTHIYNDAYKHGTLLSKLLLRTTPLWWADWTKNTERALCDYGNIYIRQTGATTVGRMKVDTDTLYFDYTPVTHTFMKVLPNTQQLAAGTKVTPRSYVLVYNSSYDTKSKSKISQQFWLYDGKLINGMYRICLSEALVGKDPLVQNVAGWVKKTDIERSCIY